MTTMTTAPAVTADRTAQHAAPQHAAPAPAPALPSVHMRALLTWLAVYPCITLAQIALGPALMPLPVALRVLVITGLVVPLVVYVLVPNLLKVRAAVLRRKQG
ncbi:hypothetical protein OHT20_22680 [Streptomyces caniferus]|uniref:Uncharacterized protein n=1 Tax=Streptomyces caniferus TaxID=285557 RepID=A0A640SM53_9ACTN|nr:hypothetical protein [Streptomyces caniferus]GFE10545.1 hypothetical protein Scani_68130 [Streptomyces caniferus]